MKLSTAYETLGLTPPFSLVELKSAYRKAALRTHPDTGGTEAEFIEVDKAYDFLKPLATGEQGIIDSYWERRLPELEKKFQEEWKKAFNKAKKEGTGLWFSTCIERFTRAYMYPKSEWFTGVLLGKKPSKEKADNFRCFLLEIAPNQRLAEDWARKYYQRELAEKQVWVFYLPGSAA